MQPDQITLMIELKLKNRQQRNRTNHIDPKSSVTPCKIVNYSEFLISDKNWVIMAQKMSLKTSNS